MSPENSAQCVPVTVTGIPGSNAEYNAVVSSGDNHQEPWRQSMLGGSVVGGAVVVAAVVVVSAVVGGLVGGFVAGGATMVESDVLGSAATSALSASLPQATNDDTATAATIQRTFTAPVCQTAEAPSSTLVAAMPPSMPPSIAPLTPPLTRRVR